MPDGFDLPVAVQTVRDLAVALAALVGAFLAWRRLGPSATAATAAQRSAGAADDQAALARRVYVTEQLRAAAGDLRAERLEVRLAAIHVLREIARDFDDLANPIFEVLQTYLRTVAEPDDPAETPPDIRAIVETLRMRIEDDDRT